MDSFLGVPYVWAGESYDGVDCSGLTMLSYNPAGIYLTHSSRVQYGEGLQVPLSDAQPSNLVFRSLTIDFTNGRIRYETCR